MIKLQQFDVFSFKYSDIRESKYSVEISIQEGRACGNLISLGDSEVLRAIRRLTDHPYDKDKLSEILCERKKLMRGANNDDNRQRLADLNTKIDSLLFIPEFISVQFANTREYDDLNRKGFTVNGEKFTWLMCGAGHQRTNRAMYCAERIYKKLNLILENGANVKEMVLAKYNAYYALSSSATYPVRKPRVCVVSDCEIEMTKTVDFVNHGEITRCDKKLNFNLFDGQGLISPTFSKLWANDVGITDYVPSAWGVRCAFIKGMCVTFDFVRFAKEIAKVDTIIDVWGTEYHIEDIDVILSQSQFKLWNAYENWEYYEVNLWINGLSWGVSKVSPKISDEKTFMMTNYQFLQVLNLTDEDVAGLCSQTIDWLKGVACGDLQKAKLYLLGNIANKYDADKAYGCVQDNFVKCLLLDSRFMGDDYIRSRILKSINKKIRESYFGNLIVDGNFMARISDPYAQCEHIFGLPIKGLLADKHHYAWYWLNKGIKKVVAMRSPLTYKTEAHLLQLDNTDECKDWYSYLTSGVVYNVWGVDCLLEAGADYDFDIVATTDNKYFIKGILGTDIPVTYEAHKPKKQKIERDGLVKIAGVGFSPEIGLLTNHSTTFHDMQSKYKKGTEQWEELERRLKVCCELQSMQIDKAKGLEIDEIPKEWTQYKVAVEKDGGCDGLNCELIIRARPYFMRYRYDNYDKDYKEQLVDIRRYCITVFGNDDGSGFEETEAYKQMQRYYGIKSNLSTNNGVMNKICAYMENQLSTIKAKKTDEDFSAFYALWEDTDIDYSLVEPMDDLRKKYLDFKQSTKLCQTDYVTWEQYFKAVRTEALNNISNNIIELAKTASYLCYVVYGNKGKDFLWDCFGAGMTERAEQKFHTATIPILDTMGKIEYLGKHYWEYTVSVSEKEENDMAKDIDEILNFDVDGMLDLDTLSDERE